MAKIGMNLVALATEVDRMARAAQDYVVPAEKLHGGVNAAGEVGLQFEGQFAPMLPHAVGQIAEWLDVPTAYFRRSVEKKPVLAVAEINAWLDEMAGKSRLVRLLDRKVRAVMSDGFRIIDNWEVLGATLPAIKERNLTIISCNVSDARMYLKAVDLSQFSDVDLVFGEGHNIFKSDKVAPGIAIGNSEVGMSRLVVETLAYTQGCTNLALFGPAIRKTHAGAKLAEGFIDVEYDVLSENTKRLTNEAILAQVKDVVVNSLDPKAFAGRVEQLRKSGDVKIQPKVEVAVQAVAKRYGMGDDVRESVLRNLIEFGSLTQYGMQAAVTLAAQKVEALSYDAATALEQAGGKIALMSPEQFAAAVEG
jgi:hypothetical protein